MIKMSVTIQIHLKLTSFHFKRHFGTWLFWKEGLSGPEPTRTWLLYTGGRNSAEETLRGNSRCLLQY